MNQYALLDSLFSTLQARTRPEDVAEMIMEIFHDRLSLQEKKILNTAAIHSLRQNAWHYSSMANSFEQPDSAAKQTDSAARMFGEAPLSATDAINPDLVEAFIAKVSKQIHRFSYQRDKLTKKQRHTLGLFKNQGWYNKRLRMCKHLENKVSRLAWNLRKYHFTRIGKSALSTHILHDDFVADANTACLVAYMAARMSRRSIFTNQSQDRAFDVIADMLLTRCENSSTTRWDVLAYVMPDDRILKNIDQETKGRLIAQWWNILTDMGNMLHDVWSGSTFNLDTMIVQRGNDSSTWNQVAGGWNQARSHWISLLHATGTEEILDAVCPGKVMRLMASDVASWHTTDNGNGLHPDTKVWAKLPKPWDVINGKISCSRETVRQVCKKNNVDPEAWIGGKGNRKAVATIITPELVHGVEVSCPHLAKILRKAGVFSGKYEDLFAPIAEGVVLRDKNGYAVRVVPDRPDAWKRHEENLV